MEAGQVQFIRAVIHWPERRVVKRRITGTRPGIALKLELVRSNALESAEERFADGFERGTTAEPEGEELDISVLSQKLQDLQEFSVVLIPALRQGFGWRHTERSIFKVEANPPDERGAPWTDHLEEGEAILQGISLSSRLGSDSRYSQCHAKWARRIVRGDWRRARGQNDSLHRGWWSPEWSVGSR